MDFIWKRSDIFWTKKSLFWSQKKLVSALSAKRNPWMFDFWSKYTTEQWKAKHSHVILTKQSQAFFKQKRLQFFSLTFALFRLLPTLLLWFFPISTNVSSVVEFQRWWVLKSKNFGQESTYSREIFFKNYGSLKSAKIVLSKSIFNVKIQLIFLKINLGLGQIY